MSKWFSAPHRRDVVVFDPPEFFWELSDRKPDGACFLDTQNCHCFLDTENCHCFLDTQNCHCFLDTQNCHADPPTRRRRQSRPHTMQRVCQHYASMPERARAGEAVIKRIVAVEGDTVEVREGRQGGVGSRLILGEYPR